MNDPTVMQFARYELNGLASLAPLVTERQSGIYILEFSNGQRYVGQTVDFRQRFIQHQHGSSHHEPWEDIVAVNLLQAEPELLNELERRIIKEQRSQGFDLRNRAGNFSFSGSSKLDEFIPIFEQRHWACGDSTVDCSSFSDAASRVAGPDPKLMTSRIGQKIWFPNGTDRGASLADAVCLDLGAAILSIPAAVSVESKYWTISDYPRTAGGRLATLNVGVLEVVYVPRELYDFSLGDEVKKWSLTHLNLPAGTLIKPTRQKVLREWRDHCKNCQAHVTSHNGYQTTPVDSVILPTGWLAYFLDPPELRLALDRFCLDLMRQNQSGIYRQWHSPELARRSYAQAAHLLAEEGIGFSTS